MPVQYVTIMRTSRISVRSATRRIRLRGAIPTVSPLLTPLASHNLLLYQSLPPSITYRQGKVRRRKDDTRVGTATRSTVERLYRVPRRLPSDGGSSGRVCRALSTRTRDRARP